MTTNIGIPENHLQEVAIELNKVLADEFLLYAKTRNYHWNVEGSNFMEMHKFYESQYEQLDVRPVKAKFISVPLLLFPLASAKLVMAELLLAAIPWLK